jgi:MscS family membrane protein
MIGTHPLTSSETMEEIAQTSREWLTTLSLNHWTEAALIALIGLLLAKIADLFLVAVVGRMMTRTNNHLDDILTRLLHRPVFTTFAMIGLTIACYSLTEELGATYLPLVLSLLKTIIIVVWLQFLLRATSSIIDSMEANPRRFSFAQRDTTPLLKNLAIVFLLLAGAYSILISWDINVTGLVASAGIVGLALSFAAQDTLSHLFAGVAILADRPYRIGDFIVLDSGERGQVSRIGLRSTRLMTRDDVEVSIPNGVMGSATIVNESSGVHRFRIRAAVGVAYGSDVERVLAILEGIGRDNEALLKDPEPRARFRAFGASSLDFELLAWIPDPSVRGLRIHEMNCAINQCFADEKIVIPFPQQDVWIKEIPQSLKD